MKKTNLIALLLIGGLSLTACGKSNTTVEEPVSNVEENVEKPSLNIESEPRYNTPIKVGFDGDLCIAGQNIAEINGYFKDNGIDVEFVNTKSGKDALGTGQIDVMTGEFGGLLVPATKGLNYVFSTSSHSGCKSLYVLDDSSYEKTSDIVGGSVGVTNGIGNSGHNTLLRFLMHDDINPDEVSVKPIDAAAVIQALENKEIEGAVLDDQFAQQFLQQGTIRPIRSLTTDEDFKKEVCCVTAFNKTFVDENPMLAELIAEQIEKGNQYVADNPAEALKALQEKNLAAGDPEVATRLLESYDYRLTNKDGLDTITSYFNDYKKLGLIDDQKSTEEYIKEYWRPLGNGEIEIINN